MTIERIAVALDRLAREMAADGFDPDEWSITLRDHAAVDRLRSLVSRGETPYLLDPRKKHHPTWRGKISGVAIHELPRRREGEEA